jgi:hypothetical protein
MRHVAAVTEDSEGVRESSMRSFGTLLRQGKIAKVKRGQFAITDSERVPHEDSVFAPGRGGQ